MALTPEQISRILAGKHDINNDGGVNTIDMVLVANYMEEQAAKGNVDVLNTGNLLTDMQSNILNDSSFLSETSNTSTGMGTGVESIVTPSPLPSMPSLSNTGTVRATGAVNWGSVPGGFQPLPPISGGRKKLYQLSKFHGGINQKSSPRDISDEECQEAENVSVSDIGRIKLLGDCLDTDAIGADVSADSIDANFPGYGLFQFTAPANQDNTVGETVITCVANGDEVDVYSPTGGTDAGWIDGLGTTDQQTSGYSDVCQIYYAAGSGLYVADANLDHENDSKVKIWVYRKDINATVAVSGWEQGNPLIDSPDEGTSTANVNMVNSVADETNAGSMAVLVLPNGEGSWNGTYHFYVSWLFDNGCETGLSYLGNDVFVAATEGKLDFNVSIMHTNTDPLGGDKRIEGARIYFQEADSSEKWLLAEASLIDGIRGALDTTFIPWNASGTNVYDMGSDASTPVHITFDAPPDVYSYSSLNAYYANEVYTKSERSESVRPTPIQIRYKTAVVGQQGNVFIGNVRVDGKHMPDSMMYCMPGKPGVFPKYNRYDSPSSDGSAIRVLAAYNDSILQFKENSLYIIDVSKPGQFYAKTVYRDLGVLNPCQVFTCPFGVAFVNKFGCFLYDGSKVTSLTSGKFDWVSQSGVSEAVATIAGRNVPCIGYDPRSLSIIVLKDIGHSAANDNASTYGAGAWVYNLLTQSWAEGNTFITNASGRRHTNFIVTTDGYLAIKRDNDGTLLNYTHVADSNQTINYITKDIDFGLPSQTKKIKKIYITYRGDGSSVTVTYGADGDTSPGGAMTNSENSGATLTNADVDDHNIATFTLNSHPSNLNSIALKFNGSAASDFEINDISILYIARPIK